VGLLLSDGWLQKGKPHWNARLGFKQGVVHSELFWHIWGILSHYCSAWPYLTKTVVRGRLFWGIAFFTRALPCFTNLYNLFYPKGIKVVPEGIWDLLTPVALAFWILGDGSARNKGLLLCTDSYTIQDIVRLMNVLMIKFHLKCTIHYDTPTQPRIYISSESMDTLRTLVCSYIHPSMLYKLGI
jgi:hypothetical protein